MVRMNPIKGAGEAAGLRTRRRTQGGAGLGKQGRDDTALAWGGRSMAAEGIQIVLLWTWRSTSPDNNSFGLLGGSQRLALRACQKAE